MLFVVGHEIVHMQYKPSHVFNVDDHPERVQNDVPNSTHRNDFINVTARCPLFLVLKSVP